LGDARDAPALRGQLTVARAVSLERGSRTVGLEAVELDDEALLRPSEVRCRVRIERLVDEGPGQVVGLEESEEAAFEVVRGGGRDDPVFFDEPLELRGSGAFGVALR
jgi:hypothetical protein